MTTPTIDLEAVAEKLGHPFAMRRKTDPQLARAARISIP